MALVLNDRVKETTTSTGTGTINLAGAPTGFQTFVAGIGTTNTTYYVIAGGSEWEVGIGTVTSGSPDTLSRDTVLESSNADALVNFSAGTKDVFCTLPAKRAFVGDAANVYELVGGEAFKLSSSADYTQIGTGGFVKTATGNVLFGGTGAFFEVTSTGPINLSGAKTTFLTPTTSAASINLPHGTAPTTPVNGDVWTTTTGVYAHVNGTTVGPFGAGGGGGTWGSITGTLSSQTDLQSALDAKAPTASPTFTGAAVFASGSNSAPSITFTGDTNTGIYKSANEVLDVAVTGQRAFSIGALAAVTGAQNYIAVKSANSGTHPTLSAIGVDANVNLDLFSKGTGSIRLNGTTTTVFYSNGNADISRTAGSTINLGIATSSVNIGGATSVINIGGSVASVTISGDTTFSLGKATFSASTTTAASANIPHGTAPTSPVNGDVWTTTAGMYARVNGTTVGPFTSTTNLDSLTDVVITSPTSGQVLKYNGTNWINDADVGGGTGNPGGATTQLQFNDAGAFGGDGDLTWDKTNNHLGLNGTVTLTGLAAEPSVPSAGTARLYARDVAGRMLPKWIGPSGVDYMLQAHMGTNGIGIWRGGATTTATTFASTTGSMAYTGASPTAPTIPTLASTNLLTQTFRSTISTGATAGGLAYIRGNQLRVWRGNAAGLGGFFVVIRFALTGTLRDGLRCFAGLVDVAANPTNIDPTTSTTPGSIGLAIAANTGNWRLVNNVTGTARTAADLGASFAVNNTHLLELALFCAPNGSSVGYRVTNWSTGAQTSGSLTTNIPAATTFLTPSVWVTNNATAAAQTLDFISCYVETDY